MDLLKQHGPTRADALAKRLGISAMAVRQHLYSLQEQRLVDYEEQTQPGDQPVGRPAKLWGLTGQADRFFPDGHADLTVGLIQSMATAFGPTGMQQLLDTRAAAQIEDYRRRVPRPGGASLRRRLEALAEIRTQEGYMAEVLEEDAESDDGALLLLENHCPICFAAKACTGLCGAELEVFQAVLGADVNIERTEHIVTGARRCAYRVRPNP
jgi:predicted ArsR family transcriptional regulator